MSESEITIHEVKTDNDSEYYCRAMNQMARGCTWLCRDCPLCAGTEENGEQGIISVKCRYADSDDEFPIYWEPSQPVRGVYDRMPQDAIRFAAVAHKGALRKGNGLPYIIHPMETMSIVSRMTEDPEVLAAAALHDVIEDTKYVGRDIEERFGRRVAELVGMESEDKKRHRPASDTWRERKEENLIRERVAPREAKLIMLSDKLSNVRSTLRDYHQVGTGVWDKFNMKDPSEQEWYYYAVAKVVSELSEEPVYKEYTEILDIIFEKH